MARVYVGTYEKYNNGSLFGEWLDCEDYADKEDFIKACLELHKDEEDPELMFQDWEDIPGGMCSECSISEKVWEYLDLDQRQRELVDAWLTDNDPDDVDALSDIPDRHYGTYESWADYAEEYTTSGDKIPEHLESYIDWERMGEDFRLSFDGVCVEHEGQIYLFSDR